MTVPQDAKTAAKAIANTPADVVVASIQTLRNALTALEQTVNTGALSGEKAVDAVLGSVEETVPGVLEPFLNLVHLSTKTTA